MGRIMAQHICPWWLGYFLVSPLRRLWQHPAKMVGPFLAEGMTILEPGCGMGYFTLDLARMAGPRGRVIAVDLQPRMLVGLEGRARKAGLLSRIEIRQAQADRLNVADLAGQVDLALLLLVLHEVPDPARFLAEIRATLKPGGRLLLVEPRGHVSGAGFDASLAEAERVGFRVAGRPKIGRSLAALLEVDAGAVSNEAGS